MLYLKNCLVNLSIIFFSLFFLTIVSADDSEFIFPKKKIIIIKVEGGKQNNSEISKDFISIDLPQKNPLRENYTQQKKQKNNVEVSELPKKKGVPKNTTTDLPKKKLTSQVNTKVKKKTYRKKLYFRTTFSQRK
jgi:hypothetical protein